MKMKLIEFIKKRFIFRNTYNNETFIKYLRDSGVEVGEFTHFFSPRSNIIDVTRPYLLKIGKRVKITAGVTILTHDFSYSLFRYKYNAIQNECSGETIIGDNCFIGINSTIMGGVHIGNNVIVSAGAVVTKDIPSNSVVAGVPAKVIFTLDEFFKRRQERQIEDAFRLANIIRKKCNREPTINDMGSFYPLFLPRVENILKTNNIRTKISGDTEPEIISAFYSSTPVFESFEDFLAKSKKVLQ